MVIRVLAALSITFSLGCASSPSVKTDPAFDVIPYKLKAHVDKNQVAGVVTAVRHHGKLVHLDTVGLADRENHLEMRPDTMFWIASMTKSITATCVMILADEGKLSLDEPASKYIPALAKIKLRDGKSPAKPITIRHLLSHTNGLSQPPRKPTDHNMTLARYADQIAAGPLEFEPGSKYEYGFGLTIAGRIVEIVSGQPFEVFMQKRIFDPLGMKDSTFYPTAEQIRRIAKTYKAGKDAAGNLALIPAHNPFVTNDPTVRNEPEPSGGLFSTATDMSRFYQMILNGGELEGKRIVSKKSVAEMTRQQATVTKDRYYGLGWFIYPDGSFGHGGAYATDGLVDPKRDLVTVFMVQSVLGQTGDTKKTFQEEVSKALGK